MTKRIFAWGLAFMVMSQLARGDAFPFGALSQLVVLGNLAFLGVLASAGCFVTWNYSVKHLGAIQQLSARLVSHEAVKVVGAPP